MLQNGVIKGTWPNLLECFVAWYRMYPCSVPLGIWCLLGLRETHLVLLALDVRLQPWWEPRRER